MLVRQQGRDEGDDGLTALYNSRMKAGNNVDHPV